MFLVNLFIMRARLTLFFLLVISLIDYSSSYSYATPTKTSLKLSNRISVVLSSAASKAIRDDKSRSGITKNKNVKSNVKKSNSKPAFLNTLEKELSEKDLQEFRMVVKDLISMQQKKQGNSQDENEDILNGVIRVYCTHSEPNYNMPWQRQKQGYSTSSGFIISKRRILTNAHAVEYGSLIQVKKRQSETKFVATAVAVGHECDLAVLEVADEAFWEDLPELTFGPIPDLLEDVSVIGYPVGGDSISISSGVVSRIEMQEYAQASADLLAIQIDAAINPGNSGGPVFNSQNEVIGVAFQSLSEEDIENIGYVVPVNVIAHFLESVERSVRTTGQAKYVVCSLGVHLQALEAVPLRRFCGLDEDKGETGVRVLSVAPLAPAKNILEIDDIILSVDGIPIANDGSIPFREGHFMERVQLNYYFTQKFENDIVRVKALRGKKRINLNVPLWAPKKLVPRGLLQTTVSGATGGSALLGVPPAYLIVGGFVFIKLTLEYIESEFNLSHMKDYERWSEEFKLMALTREFQTVENQEIVLLSQVLSNSCNIGYEHYHNLQLKKVNNQEILNLRQLRDIVDDCLSAKAKRKNTHLVFELSDGIRVAMDLDEVKAAQDQVCREHLVPATSSLEI